MVLKKLASIHRDGENGVHTVVAAYEIFAALVPARLAIGLLIGAAGGS
jgi:hypothetical protein